MGFKARTNLGALILKVSRPCSRAAPVPTAGSVLVGSRVRGQSLGRGRKPQVGKSHRDGNNLHYLPWIQGS